MNPYKNFSPTCSASVLIPEASQLQGPWFNPELGLQSMQVSSGSHKHTSRGINSTTLNSLCIPASRPALLG